MRVLRRILAGVLGIVLVVVVAGFGFYGALRAGLVTAYIEGLVNRFAQKDGVFFVRAERVTGNVPGHLRVGKVEIGDPHGVWLTIEDGEATWAPFDLFHPLDFVKWRVNVSDVRAARVTWTRLPDPDDDEDDEPFRWDRFVRIVVGHVKVDDFVLTGTILGGATAHVRAEGHGVLGEWERGRVELDLERIDSVPGRARIDLATHGSPLELSGTIHAEEGPGSALAALARLNDAGSVKLDVRASGPMRDWSGEADIDATGIGTLHVKTKLSFTAQGPFEGSGTFDPVPAQREKWLVGHGAPMRVEAKGNWAPDVELRIDRARLVADGRELVADGRLDLETKGFTVKGALAHLEPGARVRTTLVEVLGARLTGSGTLGDGGNLEAKLDLDDPGRGVVAGRTLHADFRAKDADGPSVPTFELEANAEGLRWRDDTQEVTLPLLGDAATLVASGVIDLETGVLDAKKLVLAGSDAELRGSFAFVDDWHTMKTSLEGDAKTLASIARVARTTVAGSATARLELETRDDWRTIEASVAADAANVAIGEQGWNALIGPTATLRASLRGATAGPARGELALKTIGIDATASGEVGAKGEGLRAQGKATLDNLARLAEPTRAEIAGRVDATATATGSLDDFDVEAVLHGDRVSWEGLRFDVLDARVAAAALPHAWDATVRANGRYGKLETALDASAAMPSDDRLVVRGLVLRGPRTDVKADLDIDLSRGVATGSIAAHADDLSLWRPMTGAAIGGAVAVDATLGVRAETGGQATQQVGGTAVVRDGAVDAGGSQLFIDLLDVAADGLEIGPRPRGTATLHASRVRYGDVTLVDGSASIAGDGASWAIASKLDLRDAKPIRVDAAASLRPGAAWQLDVTRLDGDVAGTAVRLDGPARIVLDDAKWSAPAFSLRVGDGRLGGSASRSAGITEIDVEADALPLVLVSAFEDSIDLEGFVDGKLRYAGSAITAATGTISLRGRDVASTGLEAQGVEPVDLVADASLARGRLTGKASLAGLTNTRLELKLDAPLTTAAPSESVVLDLQWKGELAEASALLPLGEDQLTGRVDADVRISGTVASPRVAGRATLDGAAWEHATTGLVLKDIHAELVGSGTSLALRSLTATDGEDGRVTATGNIGFAGFPAFDGSVDLEATDAMLARLDLVTAKADATLALGARRSAERGAPITGSIAGKVHIDDARIEIPQRFVADVPELDVVEVGEQIEEAAALGGHEGPSALDLDVAVVADNRIFATGRGLESEWSSDVKIRGTTADPRVEGEVKSVRGELSLLGRRFEVSSATIRFDGEKGNEPFLNLTARAEANDITAIADVTGPAMRPTIELRSEPSLPRDEVLSRVLFGQSAANLSAIQSIQLARSVAELTGSPLGGGGGLLTGIGRTLGFDRLGIESGSGGGAALTASKYLTDDVYLRVQQGLTPEDSKLAIEWRILKHVTIESDVSQDAQAEVGATWRWDY